MYVMQTCKHLEWIYLMWGFKQCRN